MGKKGAAKKKLQQINGNHNAKQKTNPTASKKQKRKSDNAEEEVQEGKKQKIEPFSGTKVLQTNNTKTPAKVMKNKKEPIPNKEVTKVSQTPEKVVKNKKESTANKQVTKTLQANNTKTSVKEESITKEEVSASKKNRRAKKRLAIKMRNQRINAAKEKLAAGGDAAKELASQLKAIVDEKQTKSELKISVTAAKKLLYFVKHGKYPEKDASVAKNLKKKEKKKQKFAEMKQGSDTKSTEEVQSKKENKKLKNEGVKTLKTEIEGAVKQTKSKKKNKKKLKPQNSVADASEESDYDVETTIKVDKVTKKMNDGDESAESDVMEDGDENPESDGIEDESENDSVEEESPPKKQKQKPKKVNIKESLEKEGLVQKGQSRYVLYVCNLPYDADVDELRQHFSKVSEVKHVRIPTEKGSNKARGFGYVEFSDETSYQKGLSLHHSMLKNRRIQVQYTMGGKKKGQKSQKVIQQKNLKLHAMRKKGILTADVKDSQKKAARKAKRKHLQPKQQAE